MVSSFVWHGVLDALPVALALFDEEGVPVHESRAFSLLAARVQEVREFSARLARDSAQAVREWHETGPDTVDESLETADLRTAAECFRLEGRYVAARTRSGKRSGIILVLVRNVVDDRAAEAVLQKLYGLTQQEARVVGILVRGGSNKQIAGILGISAHTVRHHVEHALRKLGISKRSQVPARVLGLVGDFERVP
jgi:DNA-binding CsgD family transcriptional regulator